MDAKTNAARTATFGSRATLPRSRLDPENTMKKTVKHRPDRLIVAVGMTDKGKRLGAIEMFYRDWDARSRADRLAYLSGELGKDVKLYQWNFITK